MSGSCEQLDKLAFRHHEVNSKCAGCHSQLQSYTVSSVITVKQAIAAALSSWCRQRVRCMWGCSRSICASCRACPLGGRWGGGGCPRQRCRPWPPVCAGWPASSGPSTSPSRRCPPYSLSCFTSKETFASCNDACQHGSPAAEQLKLFAA